MVGVAGHLGVDVPEAAVPVWLSQSDGVSILLHPTAELIVVATENVIKYALPRLDNTSVEKIKSIYAEYDNMFSTNCK